MSGQSDPDRKNKMSSSEEEKERGPDTESLDTVNDHQTQHGVRRKLRTLTFGRRRKALKDNSKKRKSSWAFKFPSRDRRQQQQHLPGNVETAESASPGMSSSGCNSCVCTVYRRTEDPSASGEETTVDRSSQSSPVTPDPPASSSQQQQPPPIVDLLKFNPEDFAVEDWDERARQQRAKEIEEGVDPPPGFKPTCNEASGGTDSIPLTETLALCLQSRLLLVVPPPPYLERFSNEAARLSRDVLAKLREIHFQVTKESLSLFPTVHTQVDYIHCLVPDLLEITNCSFYWGKMDRYQAEKLLENKPEGTFLLRDSAQEEYLFSVSFQRYGRSLHARIEQWNHKFSFDSHDPGVFASNTVCGLIEHYKDPSCCMYFEPMLTIPLHRTFPFSLQHLCRSVICSNISYDGINMLQLPRTLKSYLKEYHYRQRVRVRRFDMDA